MLNPKLIERYGVKSTIFFDDFVNLVGESIASKCYAIEDRDIVYGDVIVPTIIAACCDSDTCGVIDNHCVDISLKLQELDDVGDRDESIVCLQYTDEEAKKDGIKIWVS